ncbi:MAG: hypothetical protein JW929_11340 [Anaerolineales bacterium]|nr:hypothetical protein [Anaerolineales bacterium]
MLKKPVEPRPADCPGRAQPPSPLFSAPCSSYGRSIDFFGLITSLGAVVCLPILYGVLGFIDGPIGAFFVNPALKIIQGLEIEASGFFHTAVEPKKPPVIEPSSP